MPECASSAVTRHAVSSDELWYALDALILLQAHYAKRLNAYEGRRQRVVYDSAEGWVERLRDLDRLEG